MDNKSRNGMLLVTLLLVALAATISIVTGVIVPSYKAQEVPELFLVSEYLNRQCLSEGDAEKTEHFQLMAIVQNRTSVKGLTFLDTKYLKDRSAICVSVEKPESITYPYSELEDVAIVACSAYQRQFISLLRQPNSADIVRLLPMSEEGRLSVIMQFVDDDHTILPYHTRKCGGI